ncbi:MAG: hypothetical protein ACUVV6_03050 [Thermoplasmatota archaeon]
MLTIWAINRALQPESATGVPQWISPQYSRALSSGTYATDHSALVTGLVPGTTCHFRVGSGDLSGYEPVFSEDMVFSTSTARDSAPPRLLSAMVAFRGESRVEIEVALDEPAAVLMEYGSTLARVRSVHSPACTRSRTLRITGLEPGRTYMTRIVVRDPRGNTAESSEFTFRTKPLHPERGSFTTGVPGGDPLIAALIVLIAVAVIGGIYWMGRRRRMPPPPPPGGPEPPAPSLPPPGSVGGRRPGEGAGSGRRLVVTAPARELEEKFAHPRSGPPE